MRWDGYCERYLILDHRTNKNLSSSVKRHLMHSSCFCRIWKMCYRNYVTNGGWSGWSIYRVRLKNTPYKNLIIFRIILNIFGEILTRYSWDILLLVLQILTFLLFLYRKSIALNTKVDFLKCTDTKMRSKPFYTQILSYDTYFNIAERNLLCLYQIFSLILKISCKTIKLI